MQEREVKQLARVGERSYKHLKNVDIPDVNNEVLVPKTAVKEAIFKHHNAAMTKEIY